MKKMIVFLLVALASHMAIAGAAIAEIGVGGRRSAAPSSPKPLGAFHLNNPYNPYSLANPYGAGNPYKLDGLMNPYSKYSSPYGNYSWRNPYATKAPMLYGQNGRYYGRLSTNPYHRDSTSNPYGLYGSPYSPYSLKNPYGAGSPYSTNPIYVYPSR